MRVIQAAFSYPSIAKANAFPISSPLERINVFPIHPHLGSAGSSRRFFFRIFAGVSAFPENVHFAISGPALQNVTPGSLGPSVHFFDNDQK